MSVPTSTTFKLRVPTEELDRWRAAARASHLTVSEWLRRLAHDAVPIRDVGGERTDDEPRVVTAHPLVVEIASDTTQFGQLAQAVEKAQKIAPVVPASKVKPRKCKHGVDVTQRICKLCT